MNNKCLHLKLRTKKGKRYFYCSRKRAVIEITDCYGCVNKEYKKVAKMVVKTRLKPISKTNKVSKATAISTKVKKIVWERDNHKCIFCDKYVEWNFANSHFIKRSHNGLGIEENIMTNCAECHELFEHEPSRSKMIPLAKQYLKSKYDNWNEDMLVYKKWGN